MGLSPDLAIHRVEHDSLRFQFTLTNTGSESISFSTPTSDLFTLYVTTPAGEHIWSPPTPSTGTTFRSIEPGDSLDQHIHWRTPEYFNATTEVTVSNFKHSHPSEYAGQQLIAEAHVDAMDGDLQHHLTAEFTL